MRTSAECLAKAAELDGLAALCFTEPLRGGYADTAKSWRAAAAMALLQENWDAAQVAD